MVVINNHFYLMDESTVSRIIEATHWPRIMVATALGMLSLFLLVSTFSEWKQYSFIGSGVTASNTIMVDGTGEVFAVPDTATFSVTVRENAKDVLSAQEAATKRNNDIIAYLKKSGVDEKDIQTTDYNVSPQYEWKNSVDCPATSYCPGGKQELTGFEVSQTTSVKVRDTKKAGDILSGVGTLGASEVSSLSFTIADEDGLKAQAREKAIVQARDKANVLAKSLGVSVVRVVGFNESSGNPMPYRYAMSVGSADAAMAPKAAPAPEIAVGQNKIVSNVSVTYEIR